MNVMDFFSTIVQGASGNNFAFFAVVFAMILVVLLSMVGVPRGIMFVALIGFIALIAMIVPGLGWIFWLFVLAAFVMIVIGLKIWIGKIF